MDQQSLLALLTAILDYCAHCCCQKHCSMTASLMISPGLGGQHHQAHQCCLNLPNEYISYDFGKLCVLQALPQYVVTW